MSSSSTKRFLPLLTALALASAPVAAWAQTDAQREEAKDLFAEGMDLREQGKEQDAAEKFKAAYQLVKSPITTLEYGRSLMRLGKLIEARARFLEASSLPSKSTESAQAKAARKEAAQLVDKLLPRIPSLRIMIEGADSSSVTVVIDGEIVASPSAIQKLDPGKHSVSARLEGGDVRRANVDLKEGEERDIELRFDTTAGTEGAGSAAAPSAASGPSTLTWVSFGVAGGLVVVGSIAGLVAHSKASALSDSCPNSKCTPDQQPDVDSYHSVANISTWSFVFAGVAAGVGVVSLLTGRAVDDNKTAHVTPWVGLGSAGIEGAF